MNSGETHHIETALDVGCVYFFGGAPTVAYECCQVEDPGEWRELVRPTDCLGYRALHKFDVLEIGTPVQLGPCPPVAYERDGRSMGGASLQQVATDESGGAGY